jgi:hypothetical protein
MQTLIDKPVIPKLHDEEFLLSLMSQYGQGLRDNILIDEILEQNLALNPNRKRPDDTPEAKPDIAQTGWHFQALIFFDRSDLTGD